MNPYRNPKPSAPNPLPFTSTIEGVAPGAASGAANAEASLDGSAASRVQFWGVLVLGLSDYRVLGF